MKNKICSYSDGVFNIAPQIKSYAEISEIAVAEPDFLYVATKQMKGHRPIVVVTKGDALKIGTRLAVSGNNVVSSPVSGIVEDVLDLPSIYGGTTQVVVIKNDHKSECEKFNVLNSQASKEDMIEALKVSSIVDYDGVSVLDKLNSLNKDIEPTLVVNLLDDEPFVQTNSVLINKNENDCVNAIKTMAKLVGTSTVIIALTKKDQELHKSFLNTIDAEKLDLNVVTAILPNRYPVGDEVQLARAISKKHLSTVKECRENGFIVFDLFTMYSVNNLITKGEIVTKRPVSIIEQDGKSIKTSNAWLTIGTSIKDLLNSLFINGNKIYCKIVAGGPMRGIALGNDISSITFSLKSVMLVKDKITDVPQELPCITCGKCAKVCPVGIVPYEIDECANSRDFNQAARMGASKCIKCGCCSYICPSKRALTQRICYAKEIINNKGIKNE